jgi:hypothetical protein
MPRILLCHVGYSVEKLFLNWEGMLLYRFARIKIRACTDSLIGLFGLRMG